MDPRDRLIVALDVDSFEKAEELIHGLGEEVDIFKVGVAPFTAFGDRLMAVLAKARKKVFLDLKYHDIPNTVRNAADAATGRQGVFMMNFHCLGGGKMLRSAVDGARIAAERTGRPRPFLLGVTVLTSMDEQEMAAIGINGRVKDKVRELAVMAKEAGLDGVVASAREASLIKEVAGTDFLVVTPGIRPQWAAKGDQKRVLTPKEAIAAGSDYLVVGRPVIQSSDPADAARMIKAEMK